VSGTLEFASGGTTSYKTISRVRSFESARPYTHPRGDPALSSRRNLRENRKRTGAFLDKAIAMSNSSEPREAARQRAQNYFTQTEKRDAVVKEEIEKERNQRAAKTAKLRALRLAKEASDAQEASRMAAENPVAAKPRRKRAVKA
jgi:hypothetical protein